MLYENVFQNPELFPTQVSLSPVKSTLFPAYFMADPFLPTTGGTSCLIFIKFLLLLYVMREGGGGHSDYRTVSPYWVLPAYVEMIRAVGADDGDRPLLF
jgi:hypothetical protein